MSVTEDRSGYMNKVKFTITSTSAGASSDVSTYRYNGIIKKAVFIPDAAATQPTDAFDLVITDGDSVDVLNGLGANLSNAATTQKADIDGLGVVKSSLLTCTGSGLGDVKGATAILYILDIDKA